MDKRFFTVYNLNIPKENNNMNAPDIGRTLTPSQLPASLTKRLTSLGFESIFDETWGRVVGEATAFLQVGELGTLAWLYAPEKEAFIGPRLHVDGVAADAVPHALEQLDELMGSHLNAGAEVVSLSNEWEQQAL